MKKSKPPVKAKPRGQKSGFFVDLIEAEELFLERMGWKYVFSRASRVYAMTYWSSGEYEAIPRPLALLIEKGRHPRVFSGVFF